MPKKIKLNLENLNVESFVTNTDSDIKGGCPFTHIPIYCHTERPVDCHRTRFGCNKTKFDCGVTRLCSDSNCNSDCP